MNSKPVIARKMALDQYYGLATETISMGTEPTQREWECMCDATRFAGAAAEDRDYAQRARRGE